MAFTIGMAKREVPPGKVGSNCWENGYHSTKAADTPIRGFEVSLGTRDHPIMVRRSVRILFSQRSSCMKEAPLRMCEAERGPQLSS